MLTEQSQQGFYIKGYADVVIKDYMTQDPILFLNNTIVTQTVLDRDIKAARGGAYSSAFVLWQFDTNDSLQISVNNLSLKLMGLVSVAEIQKEEIIFPTKEIRQVEEGNEVELKRAPVKKVFVYFLSDDGATIIREIEDYNINNTTLKINDPEIEEQDHILIYYYSQITASFLDVEKTTKQPYYSIDIFARARPVNGTIEDEVDIVVSYPKITVTPGLSIYFDNENDRDLYIFEIKVVGEDPKGKRLMRLQVAEE